ncbi:response regulator [Oceanicella sp. SM1341]|uniref:response regulator n=1 Tax=Oceanicella sp. SM1341 TaxID=1548889 RepID=UPI000E4762A1|nr:response regulator [Oceanicella sp. SM1341]
MPQAQTATDLSSTIAAELPYLRRYARALTGTQARGDGYAAATLETLIANRESFDLSLAPRVALFKVFHSIWSTTGAAIEEPADDIDPLERVAQQRLADLTPHTREAVLLSALEGFGTSEIAAVMDVSEAEAANLVRIGEEEVKSRLNGRILIIEDEPIIAMDIRSIVSSMDHECVGIARTRDEAVKMYSENDVDLVLADIQLADGSSGIDAAHDILSVNSATPIIFITAFPERLLTGERPEPTFLISKPFKEEQVRAAVSQALFFSSTARMS